MFHVSRQFIGQSVLMKPQIPRSAPQFEDRTISRICVSPTIEQCMMGIAGTILKEALKLVKHKDWYIYTTSSWDYIPAKDVFDHIDTEEHWFLEPTKFQLYGTICSASAQKGILKVNSLSNNILARA